MTEALRPMSTGELLDRTFRLYKTNFSLFVGLALPAPAIVILLVLLSMLAEAIPADKISFGPVATGVSVVLGIILGSLGLLFGFALTVAATIRGVSALHLSKPTSLRQCYAELRGHYLRIVSIFLSVSIRVLGGSFLLYFASILVGVVAAGAASLLGTIGVVLGVVVAIAGFIGGILLALTLVVRYSMAAQACVVEDISPNQAIKRSVFLAKGDRSRILTVYVLFSVISLVVWTCLAFLAGFVGALLGSTQAITVFMSLALFLSLLLTMPPATIAMSLAYYDERVRKEGFDLQLMISTLEAPAPAVVIGSL